MPQAGAFSISQLEILHERSTLSITRVGGGCIVKYLENKEGIKCRKIIYLRREVCLLINIL